MFSKAIVRKPAPEMVNGLTTAGLGKPDFSKAVEQHQKYVDTLVTLGLEVTTLGPDSRYPDSVFVEDTAVVCDQFGLISRPGAVTRRGEILEMEGVLHRFYKTVEFIVRPGTLDGGDVLQVGDHFYIGLSQRTNKEGAKQLIRVAEKHGMSGETVSLHSFLHLKSGVSYLGDNVIVVSGELTDHPVFAGYRKIVIPKKETYAANCLWVNDTVLVGDGFPATAELIEKAGFTTKALPVSEFRKLDGGLSCLSLRF